MGAETLVGVTTTLFGLGLSLPLIALVNFWFMLAMPISNGCSQAIWQTKVAPDVQGRVFAVRRMIAWSMMPLAYIVAGPLADRLFRPLLVDGGALAGSVGQLIGVGPGRGTGFMFIVVGAISIIVAALGYLNPHVRNVEDELPDAVLMPAGSSSRANL